MSDVPRYIHGCIVTKTQQINKGMRTLDYCLLLELLVSICQCVINKFNGFLWANAFGIEQHIDRAVVFIPELPYEIICRTILWRCCFFGATFIEATLWSFLTFIFGCWCSIFGFLLPRLERENRTTDLLCNFALRHSICHQFECLLFVLYRKTSLCHYLLDTGVNDHYLGEYRA